MPLPLIFGAAAVVTAAYGAKKGYEGYQKHSEADEIVKSAKERYDSTKASFDSKEKDVNSALETLGKKELEIGQQLGEFKTRADGLLQQLNADRKKNLEINIPKHELHKIECYSYTATSVLGTVAGAGVAGAAAGFAVYGGVMALGAASTGTAISSLAGVAATNATLAAIGGGSLAAGGLGMAGGTAILGAAVAAPILAIAGWAYDSHGDEALKNARKVDAEAGSAIEKLVKAMEQLQGTRTYVLRVKHTLSDIDYQFTKYFDRLKEIDGILHDLKGRDADVEAELANFNDAILRTIENGYALASILVNLITTPLFKLKKVNGQVETDAAGVPVMEKDTDGSMVLNETELHVALTAAKAEAGKIKAA